MGHIAKLIKEKEETTAAGLELQWWNTNELRSMFDFDAAYPDGYLDYFLIVDKTQFKEIVLQQEQYLDKGIYSYPEWIKSNAYAKKALDKQIRKMNHGDKVKICLSEI